MPTVTVPPLDDRDLTDTERAAVLDRVDEILEITYRSRDLGNFTDPLDELVYILLSRQTREPVYQRVYRDLRSRWSSWAAIIDVPAEELAEVLAPAGFGPTRGEQLQCLLSAVRAAATNHQAGPPGDLSLNWLRALPDDQVIAFLTSLPGIGPKSARCVLHYALGRSAFAVDTHVRRILHRLRIVPDRGGKVRHEEYERLIPAAARQRLHVNLIHHGRAVCRTSAPRCTACPLVSFCDRGRLADHDGDDRPVAVEIFAGGGGMAAGFTEAGFRIAVAIELDRDAAQTYRANHPGTVVLEADARRVDGKDITRLVPSAAAPSAIIAGPPCQGYSAAGARQPEDQKNLLFLEVIRLARQLQPRFVVIENVPGMRGVGGVTFVDAVLRELRSAGYAAIEELLRACDFGVPQLRRRLFFLAQRRVAGQAPISPRATHCPGPFCSQGCGLAAGSKCGMPPTPTVRDSLASLPELGPGEPAEYMEYEGMTLINGSTMRHSDAVITKISRIEAGKGPISYRRLHQELAHTIVAGHRALPVHPTLHRTISVREAARIQGFRDEHAFCGKRVGQPLQVANAVPPALASAAARSLLEALDLKAP